jgi:hypothetical protein
LINIFCYYVQSFKKYIKTVFFVGYGVLREGGNLFLDEKGISEKNKVELS